MSIVQAPEKNKPIPLLLYRRWPAQDNHTRCGLCSFSFARPWILN